MAPVDGSKATMPDWSPSTSPPPRFSAAAPTTLGIENDRCRRCRVKAVQGRRYDVEPVQRAFGVAPDGPSPSIAVAGSTQRTSSRLAPRRVAAVPRDRLGFGNGSTEPMLPPEAARDATRGRDQFGAEFVQPLFTQAHAGARQRNRAHRLARRVENGRSRGAGALRILFDFECVAARARQVQLFFQRDAIGNASRRRGLEMQAAQQSGLLDGMHEGNDGLADGSGMHRVMLAHFGRELELMHALALVDQHN